MTREEEIKSQSKKRHFEKYNCEGFCPDFEYGAKWADKTMIEKACEWLKDNANEYLDWYDWEECRVNKDELLYDFREAMKGE